jgi:hypothetical protein
MEKNKRKIVSRIWFGIKHLIATILFIGALIIGKRSYTWFFELITKSDKPKPKPKKRRKKIREKIENLASKYGGRPLIVLLLLTTFLHADYTNINLSNGEMYLWPDKDTYILYVKDYATNTQLINVSYSNEEIKEENDWLGNTWEKYDFCGGGILGVLFAGAIYLFIPK